MNYLKAVLLLAAMTALFGAVGFLIGGEAGMLIALGVAAAMNLFAYWNSDKMVLKMYRAREVDARTAPEFHGLVAELARNRSEEHKSELQSLMRTSYAVFCLKKKKTKS